MVPTKANFVKSPKETKREGAIRKGQAIWAFLRFVFSTGSTGGDFTAHSGKEPIFCTSLASLRSLRLRRRYAYALMAGDYDIWPAGGIVVSILKKILAL
jgi:hypothetical protein